MRLQQYNSAFEPARKTDTHKAIHYNMSLHIAEASCEKELLARTTATPGVSTQRIQVQESAWHVRLRVPADLLLLLS